ncbi:MAG: hypothetical protein I8H75_05680 [Myxococcaceae bacterium]|nr:hypothetical protein [Myxococcaceae bacterium]MBH2006807.1 hypothetical protein [Myxococcaceae bacterium]
MSKLDLIFGIFLSFFLVSCHGDILKVADEASIPEDPSPTKNRTLNPSGTLGFYVTPQYALGSAWAVDYSVKDFRVYSLNEQGDQSLASFECSTRGTSILCYSAQPLFDSTYVIVNDSSKLSKTYQRIISLTAQHPIAGKTEPLVVGEFDAEVIDYLLKRIAAHPAYDFQNVLVDSSTSKADPFNPVLLAYGTERLMANVLKFSDYMVAHPTLFQFLAKAPICNSQLTFSTDGIWPQTKEYHFNVMGMNAKVIGKAATTQFAKGHQVQFKFDSDSRATVFSDSSYMTLKKAGQDVVIYSKCTDSPDTVLSYQAATSYAMVQVDTHSLPSLISGQTSHLRMLAVKVDANSYAGLQAACLTQSNSVEPSQLLQQFVPWMALLASSTDEGREELGDWIGRSRCLCAENFNPPLDSPNLLVGYHDNFSVSFPLGAPGIPVAISPVNQTVYTDRYGIAKLCSNQFQKSDTVGFEVDHVEVARCDIPGTAQGSHLQTFRNGFFYDCYEGQNGHECECALHFVPDVSGQACIECKANQVSVNKSCQDCPSNQVQANNQCKLCSPKIYGSGSCLACPSGSYSNDGIHCEPACQDEQIVGIISGTTYGCKSCPEGQIGQNHQCKSCKVGQYASGNTCLDCPADQVVVENSCQPCASGKIAYRGTCLSCGLGQYVSSNQCVLCPTNQIVNDAKNGCQSCPAEEHANNYRCTKCSAGQIENAESCSTCQSGYAAFDHQCILAAAGCPFDTIAIDGVCTSCPSGTQSNSLGACSSGEEGSVCAVNSDCTGNAYCSGTQNHTQTGRCVACGLGEKHLYLSEGCTDGKSGSLCDVYSDCYVLGGFGCNMSSKKCE